MTVTAIDPPGPLANTSEPLDFTTDRPVLAISVEYNPQLGNGLRECVYDGTDDTGFNGNFSYLYRASTRTGTGPYTYTVRRQGRWPASLRLRVKEAPLNGALTPSAALQPSLYSPVAQYALQGASDASGHRVWADRSGNGLDLSAGTPTAVADLVAGQTAVRPVFAGRLKRAAAAALQITGDLTVTLRVKRDASGAGQLLCLSGLFGAGNTQNTLYSLYASADGSFSYGYEVSAGSLVTVVSSVGLSHAGQWDFVSFRRNSAKMTWGVNDTYDDTVLSSAPTGGSAAFLTIGDIDEAADTHFGGALADVCIWASRLTDSQLVPLYRAAMGL